jgi:hypothetical protein
MSNKFDILKTTLERITGLKYPHCLNAFTYEGSRDLDDCEPDETCECTQDNLRTIHIFMHKGQSIIIGSKCIEKFENNLNLGIKNKIKQFENDKKYKECLICNEKNININTKHVNPIHNDICKDCSKNNKIDCMISTCPYRLPIEKDYNGNYKRLCWGCYKKKSNCSLFK